MWSGIVVFIPSQARVWNYSLHFGISWLHKPHISYYINYDLVKWRESDRLLVLWSKQVQVSFNMLFLISWYPSFTLLSVVNMHDEGQNKTAYPKPWRKPHQTFSLWLIFVGGRLNLVTWALSEKIRNRIHACAHFWIVLAHWLFELVQIVCWKIAWEVAWWEGN